MHTDVTCARCERAVGPPASESGDWFCPVHGAVAPLHFARQADVDILELVRRLAGVPVWLPWPMLPDWTVTGVAWAGDERRAATATVVACTGPAPLGGVADIVLVAEEPGVGVGARYAGLPGPDPGPQLTRMLPRTTPHAKVVAAGHPTPLWSLSVSGDRSVYVGEAHGRWLWTVAWPEEAGYILAEHLVLVDCRDDLPGPLPFGAPSPYL